MRKSLIAAFLIAATSGAFAQAPSAQPTTPPTTVKPAVTAPTATTPVKPVTTPAKPAARIDINTAALAELQTLKGIGQARAEAIVKGRPFKSKDELLEKKIVPQNVYSDIKDQIVARQKN